MNNKKILVIAGGTYVSGAEIVTLSVIKGLKENGFDIFCVVSGWNDGDFIQRLEKIGVLYKAIKLGWYYITKLHWSFASLINYPAAIIKYYRIQKEFNPDLVYVTSFRPIILLYPFLKKKIIYYAQDSHYKDKRTKFIRIAEKKVDKFMACSCFIKEDLIKCGINEKKVEVVYNGVELNVKKEKVKNEEDIVRIGIVGQVISRKGHHILIDALNSLNESNVDKFVLHIYGSGEVNYISELKRKIEEYRLVDKVKWEGFKKDINDIYPYLDIVVVPTLKDEPFGLVAAEPAAWNIPAIVSNTGGLKEIIRDGINGFLFENENSVDLAEKLSLLITDEKLRSSAGEKAKEILIGNFTTQIQNASIKEILRKL